jgi:hypothetical protein
MEDQYFDYVYDPEETRHFFNTKDFDWFIRCALDMDQRAMLNSDDILKIKDALQRIQQ